MAGTNDADDQLFEDEETEVEETEETEETESSEDEETEDNVDEKTKKRLSDLQSKADKAEARANKAEKALQAASDRGASSGSNDPAQAALMQELREASLDAMYAEFPQLAQYNIDRSLIEGSTRAQMRESATSVVSLIKNVATKARNETLAKHGIKAEPAGQTRQSPVDYGSMSEEAFNKLLDSM
jgi:hypothetical protein